ncbi:N4-gp56 family major capsid protein, partial [Eubacteriales bacterium OttesenSCG-928-K08]|nr:N4-gp56 family major capsid protein [Eubacteriales bacterium OttesenSCG-928-K08]
MSNIQTTINTIATANGGTHMNKEFYDRKLLETASTKQVHAKFGQKRTIPKNSGKKVEFRRYDLFEPSEAITPLVEGVTPEGQTLSQSKVEAEVAQYGAYVEVSDMLELTAYDEVVADSADLLGEQLGTVMEWITRDAICAGTNVQYAGGKTARGLLTLSDRLTVDEIRKAVRTIKKAKPRYFADSKQEDGKKNARNPHFICICSPEATYDLQSDPLWQDTSKYSNAEQIYSGEIGRLFGVVFVESTEAKVFAKSGAVDSETGEAIDVHATLIFGADAYGVVDIGGLGVLETIVKTPGSAGAMDPLNQRGTVGAKV